MSSFAAIGSAGGPIGTGIGLAADIGLSLFGGGKKKRAIEEAALAEQEQFERGITGAEQFVDVSRAAVDPQLTGGQTAATTLTDLLTGTGTRTPTRGEDVATQQALEAINRQASGSKQLLSGPRLARSGQVAADIGSQFRQQDIANLLGLSSQGLQAAGLGQQAGGLGLGVTSDFIRDIGASKAGARLGKSEVTQRTLGDIGRAGGNLLDLLGDIKKPQVKGAGPGG